MSLRKNQRKSSIPQQRQSRTSHDIRGDRNDTTAPSIGSSDEENIIVVEDDEDNEEDVEEYCDQPDFHVTTKRQSQNGSNKKAQRRRSSLALSIIEQYNWLDSHLFMKEISSEKTVELSGIEDWDNSIVLGIIPVCEVPIWTHNEVKT